MAAGTRTLPSPAQYLSDAGQPQQQQQQQHHQQHDNTDDRRQQRNQRQPRQRQRWDMCNSFDVTQQLGTLLSSLPEVREKLPRDPNCCTWHKAAYGCAVCRVMHAKENENTARKTLVDSPTFYLNLAVLAAMALAISGDGRLEKAAPARLAATPPSGHICVHGSIIFSICTLSCKDFP